MVFLLRAGRLGRRVAVRFYRQQSYQTHLGRPRESVFTLLFKSYLRERCIRVSTEDEAVIRGRVSQAWYRQLFHSFLLFSIFTVSNQPLRIVSVAMPWQRQYETRSEIATPILVCALLRRCRYFPHEEKKRRWEAPAWYGFVEFTCFKSNLRASSQRSVRQRFAISCANRVKAIFRIKAEGDTANFKGAIPAVFSRG